MDKLNEERADLVKKVEKEKSHLASIHREIKKRKDYIRSLHLLEENRYDNIQAQKQYNGLLHILKKYQVDMEQVPEEFRRQTQSIRDASRGLEFGQKGEEKAAEAIKLLGNKVLSLQNLRLKYQKLDIEHDLVIIAPTGIFSVEVKNKRHNGTITEKGILKSGSHSENLIEQIRRHTNSLNQHLEELYKKQPQMKKKLTVYPIILWANNHSNVKDCFHEVPVCYINRLEYEIFKKDKYKANLSRKEMEEMNRFGLYESGTKVTSSPTILFARLDVKEILEKVNVRIAEQEAAQAAKEPVIDIEAKANISFDDFSKLQFQVGEILSCEAVPKADKLLCSQVKIGSHVRQIVSGIRSSYTPEEMVGKKVMVLVNLEPRKIRGLMSEGMLLCAEDEHGVLSLMTPDKPMTPGAEIC